MSDAAKVVARTAPHERLARDWELVLMAVGIPCEVERRGGDWDLIVDVDDVDRAVDTLAAHDADKPPARPVPPPIEEYGRSWGGVLMIAVVVLASRLAGPSAGASWIFRAGEARAQAIRDGELWRTVTALTLHADVTHLFSNVASGIVVATAVCWTLGPGVAAWLLLASGAIGNWATAALHDDGHRSVGASTAIFGGIGILAGLAIVRRPRRAWVPFAAGLALLGLLGTSARSDLLAHFFGFFAGVLCGALAAIPPLLRSRVAQAMLGFAALAVVVACWWIALVNGWRG